MKTPACRFIPVALLLASIANPSGAADTFILEAHAVVAGGVSRPSQSGAFTLVGATVGQPYDVGEVASEAGVGISAGFWASDSDPEPSDSDVIASDAFTYPDGSALDQEGGTGAWTSRWIGYGFRIADGALDGAQSPPLFNRLSRGIDDSATTSALFVGIDLTTPETIDASDFATVTLEWIPFFASPLQFGKLEGAGDWSLAGRHSGIPVQPLTEYRLVGAYDNANASWSLWVDPDEADYYDPASGRSSADFSVANQSNISPPPRSLYIDTSKPGYVMDNLVLALGPGGVGLKAKAPLKPGLEQFSDKDAFLAASGSSSATGPLPDLGTVHDAGTGQDPAESPFIGSLRFTAAPGGDNVHVGADWYGPLPGNDIALGFERLEVLSNRPIRAFGFDFAEPDATMPPELENTPVDSEFEVVLFLGAGEVGRLRFNAPDDVATFVGFTSDQPFDRVHILELTPGGELDDEFFGQFYTDAPPPPPAQAADAPVAVDAEEGVASVSLAWPGETGSCVLLQSSDDMLSWRDVARHIVLADGTISHSASIDPGAHGLYFRLAECP